MKSPCISPTRHSNPPAMIFVTHASAQRVYTCSSAMHDEMNQTSQLFFMASNSTYHTVGVIYKDTSVSFTKSKQTGFDRGATAAAQRFPTCRGQPFSETTLESWYLSFGKLRVWDSRILSSLRFLDSSHFWSHKCKSTMLQGSPCRPEKTQLFHSTHHFVETRFGRSDG